MTNNEILAESFEKALKIALPDLTYSIIGTPPSEFVIPAKSEAFGGIRASMDESEVTVYLGHVHHSHCAYYHHGEAITEETLRAAAEAAVDWIKDVLDEKVYIRVYRTEDRILGSSSGYQAIKEESIFQGFHKARYCDTYRWPGLLSTAKQ